jgi:hypothetical protein
MQSRRVIPGGSFDVLPAAGLQARIIVLINEDRPAVPRHD